MKTIGYLVRVPSGVPLFFRHDPKKDLPHSEVVELVAKPAPLPTCAQLNEFKECVERDPWVVVDLRLIVDLTGEYPQWRFKGDHAQALWEKFIK